MVWPFVCVPQRLAGMPCMAPGSWTRQLHVPCSAGLHGSLQHHFFRGLALHVHSSLLGPMHQVLP
jgi:hypothetical protein